jgi:DNA (cytosine-5)-methyltransferase 1
LGQYSASLCFHCGNRHPCQKSPSTNTATLSDGRRERDDHRNTLVHQFANVVRIVRPEGLLVENLVGLRDMNFVESVGKLFQDLGYRFTSVVVRAADYGAPQFRHRIFFVGRRGAVNFVFPPPTFAPSQFVTVSDAIIDSPELFPGEQADKSLLKPQTEYQTRMRSGSSVFQGHVASNHPAHFVKAISYIPVGGNRRDIQAGLRLLQQL